MNEIYDNLNRDGFIHLKGQSKNDVQWLCSSLGKIICETDVVVDLSTSALVTSDSALDVHTDHNKAKYVVWYCLKQTTLGGVTLLVDTREILSKLESSEKRILENIMLYEHKVFDDDYESRPLLCYLNGKAKIYYSFWLVNEDDKKKEEFRKFKSIIDSNQKIEVRLEVGDVLIVDNQRILHGRSKIEGTKDRHLKRFWISKTKENLK